MNWTTLRRLAALGCCCAALSSIHAAEPQPDAENAGPAEIAGRVRTKLATRLPGAGEKIAVEARQDAVELSGTVASPAIRAIAIEAAESVRGVTQVTHRLEVVSEPRADAAVARDVQAALRHDPATAAFEPEVSVTSGVVTLRGEVGNEPAKRLVTWIAEGVLGVREVRNEMHVPESGRADESIREELARHFSVNPLFNDDEITVTVRNGAVTLSGEVDTALEKTWAREDAWVPGVRQVDNVQLRVNPPRVGTSRVAPLPLRDEDIRQAIERALVYDPRVSSFGLEVSVRDGVATLRGSVANRKAHRTALELARHSGGVREVIDRVELRSERPRKDDAILADLIAALERSAALANNRIDLTVSGGRVTLRGDVDSGFERWLAEDLADRTAGVANVRNELSVGNVPAPDDDEIAYYGYPKGGANIPWIYSPARGVRESDESLANAVRQEMEENPLIMVGDVQVQAERGVVTLRGRVESISARLAATDAAYRAGARAVHNRLQIGDNLPTGPSP